MKRQGLRGSIFSAVMVVALAVGMWAAPAAEAASVRKANRLFPVDGRVSKRIFVEGQAVDVVVDVHQAQLTTTQAPPQEPTVLNVQLQTPDNSPLPADLKAVRLRLERVNPPMRVVRTPLVARDETILDGGVLIPPGEVPFRNYDATSLPRYRAGARLRAIVTLTTSDETRIVRVGMLQVAQPLRPIQAGDK